MHHVIAAKPPVARNHIAHHEGFSVAHVQIARRVREHVEHIATFLASVINWGEGGVTLPELLPFLLSFNGVVAATHCLAGH